MLEVKCLNVPTFPFTNMENQIINYLELFKLILLIVSHTSYLFHDSYIAYFCCCRTITLLYDLGRMDSVHRWVGFGLVWCASRPACSQEWLKIGSWKFVLFELPSTLENVCQQRQEKWNFVTFEYIWAFWRHRKSWNKLLLAGNTLHTVYNIFIKKEIKY